jgi:hypothetical protein
MRFREQKRFPNEMQSFSERKKGKKRKKATGMNAGEEKHGETDLNDGRT